MLAAVKLALRISQVNTAFDGEITGLIDAARGDLILAGISEARANDETDALATRAVILYAKAYFGFDNPDQERNVKAYTSLKAHLMTSVDYVEADA
jgi:uncharacterized phage protein (predicted DNA packaging)